MRQTCFARQSSVPALLLSSLPATHYRVLSLVTAARQHAGLYLLDEFATFIKVSGDVIIRIIIDKDFFVSQVPLVKARDDRTSVQHVRDTAFL